MSEDLPDDESVPLLFLPEAGKNLGLCCADVADLARTTQTSVIFVFNAEPLLISPGDTEDQILEAWSRSRFMARQARRERRA